MSWMKSVLLSKLTLLFAISLSSQASIVKLSEEFLNKNSSVFQEKAKAQISMIEKDLILAQKTWGLDYSYLNNDNKLENSTTTFAVTGLETELHSIGLSKSFGWGGTLSLDNNMYSYKSSGTSYQFNQTLSYSQNLGKDFFGKQFYNTVNQYENLAKQQESNSKNSIQTNLRTFALVLTQAQLQKGLYDLQVEAQKRAKRRLSLIKKKVRDGLRERVDLLQAQTDLLKQKEQVEATDVSLNNQIENLVNHLERSVSASEISKLQIEAWEKLPEGNVSNNLNKAQLESYKKANELAYENSSRDYLPSVTLSASVKTNDYDMQRSETISNGKFGGDNKEVTVGLNLSWALGLESEKLEKAKARLNLETSKKLLAGKESSLDKTEQILKKNLRQLDKNIEFSKERLILAEKTLKEYNRLYNRGRSDLDQVIRAEESLINTQVSHLRYLANRREVLFNLASLYGNLENYILGN